MQFGILGTFQAAAAVIVSLPPSSLLAHLPGVLLSSATSISISISVRIHEYWAEHMSAVERNTKQCCVLYGRLSNFLIDTHDVDCAGFIDSPVRNVLRLLIRPVSRQVAELSSVLEDSTAQNTFFAPTDQAFLDFENQLGISNATLLANRRLVKQESPCDPANGLHSSTLSRFPF